MIDKETVLNSFKKLYGGEGDIQLYHSPGRVNLIGEHIDYNGGYVFPCALTFGTFGAVRKRGDNYINLASANIELKVQADLEDLSYKETDGWGNFPKGVIKKIFDLGLGDKISGADVYIAGNIPNASGLSSSASVEVLTFAMFDGLFSLGLDKKEMAIYSQNVENEYIGVNCGIMDQFAVAMGKENHAIKLDCNKIEHEYVPLDLKGMKIVIANTNKRRELADSKYNERRSECDAAIEALRTRLNIELLCELTSEQFEANKDCITNPTVLKRAKHVVYENERVIKAVDVLKSGDLKEFGKLMTGSHESLRDLYEVTGVELDTIVSESLKIDGVIGSRMTGAGFGGCAVSIVKEDCVEDYIRIVGENYKKIIGIEAAFYVAGAGDGVVRVK